LNYRRPMFRWILRHIKGAVSKTSKAYFPTAQISSPRNRVLLILYLGKVKL
jgi:hypothetical protein